MCVLLVASSDKCVKLWDLEDWEELSTVQEGLDSGVLSIAISTDNTFILVGCEDKTLHVRSFTTGSEIHQLKGHNGQVNTLVTGI